MDRANRGYTDGHAFTLKYPRPTGTVEGLRIVISSKVAKKATQRNLVKRRLRHAWRVVGRGPLPYIYVKKAALSLTFAQLKSELTKLLDR